MRWLNEEWAGRGSYMPRWGAILLAGMLICLVIAGCGDDNLGDADTKSVVRGSAEVIQMPDDFSNVAMKCDGHGHRVYSADTAIAVVEDPTCK